eukprot:2514205-Amphidinium_carterae.1
MDKLHCPEVGVAVLFVAATAMLACCQNAKTNLTRAVVQLRNELTPFESSPGARRQGCWRTFTCERLGSEQTKDYRSSHRQTPSQYWMDCDHTAASLVSPRCELQSCTGPKQCSTRLLAQLVMIRSDVLLLDGGRVTDQPEETSQNEGESQEESSSAASLGSSLLSSGGSS